MISQAHRAYIYRIATAAVPLTVFYGLLAENAAALWLGLIGAVLATGTNALAATNTPTKQAPTPSSKMLREAANILETAPYRRTATAAWLRDIAQTAQQWQAADKPITSPPPPEKDEQCQESVADGDGRLHPCDQPAIGWASDPEFGRYPVCPQHLTIRQTDGF